MIDSQTAALDVFGGAGANRDTANAEQFLPVMSLFPMSLCGVYNLTITGNSVNSANIVIIIYVLSNLLGFFQKEIVHEKMFSNVRNLSLFEQQRIGQAMLLEMDKVILNHQEEVMKNS